MRRSLVSLVSLLGRLALLLPALSVLPSNPLLAQPEQVVLAFDEGSRLFEAGEFAGALEAFQRAESAGYASTALYYNIGSTYFRLNRLGWAIVYFERARRLDPRNPSIAHSLRVARERTEDRFSRIPDPIWTRAWSAVVAGVKPHGLFIAGLLLYLIGLGLATRRIWSGARDEWTRRGMVAGLIAGGLLLAAGLQASYRAGAQHEAVVLETSSQVLENPDENSEAVVIVHEGLLVDIVGRGDGWFEVRLPNGVTGWIQSSTVVEV